MSKKHQSLLMLILVAIIWGGGFIATNIALSCGLPVDMMMALRFSIGATTLGLVFHRQLRGTNARTARRGIVAGIFLWAAFYVQILGQSMTTVSHTSFLTSTNVIFIPFLLWVLDKRRPPLRTFLLSLLVLAGISFLSFQREEKLSFNLGDALCLLCALLFAMQITYVGRMCQRDDPTQIAFWQLITAASLSILMVLMSGRTGTPAQIKNSFPPILYLGLLSTCLCYYLQTHAQKHVPPAQAGISLSMEGVFGALFSILLGMEPLKLNVVLGGVAIMTAVILTESGGAKPKEVPAQPPLQP